MHKVYSFSPRFCALCERRVRSTRLLALYMVGSRAAIQYTLCSRCTPQMQRGLPQEQLRALDRKLEAEAQRLGLTSTH